MKYIPNKSIEDSINIKNKNKKIKNIKNYIFREFEKNKDKFIATNKFYISEEIDGGKMGFHSFDINEKIIPYSENENIYISLDNRVREIEEDLSDANFPESGGSCDVGFQPDTHMTEIVESIKKHKNLRISCDLHDSFSHLNSPTNKNKYIDLTLVSNISFTIDDININKNDIIQKFIENDSEIDEKLFEDLYYNKDFSNKINIELPKKYNDKKIIIEGIEADKKYLFKINFIELNCGFYEENNLSGIILDKKNQEFRF